jgi:hypothetical protein
MLGLEVVGDVVVEEAATSVQGSGRKLLRREVAIRFLTAKEKESEKKAAE